METFNPDTFLETQFEGENSTRRIPCPIGNYPAVVEKIAARKWQGKNDPTQSGVSLDIFWSVDDEGVKAELDQDKVIVKQGLMLDMTESGSIDMGKGKNVPLGRLREALGLNKPGEPFSFNMLVGQFGRVEVGHRQDKNNPEDIYAEVTGVTAL